MTEVVVIGDVHGVFDTLVALVTKVREQFPNATICMAGDLCDRGNKSREVVKFVRENDILCVMGNHEQMMFTDIDGTTEYPGSWVVNGGYRTLQSYQNFDNELAADVLWMKQLPLYLEFPDCKIGDRYLVVSHASLGTVWNFRDPAHPKHNFFEEKVLWNRDAPKDQTGIYNCFGHTPNEQPRIKSYYANIDTGAVFNRSGYTKLTALAFPSMNIIQQENIDV